MFRWFFPQNELRAAKAAMVAELPEHATIRRRVRELWDAARLLELSPEIAAEPRTALHLEALRIAAASPVRLEAVPSIAVAPSVSSGPATLHAASPSLDGGSVAETSPSHLAAPTLAPVPAPAPLNLTALRAAHADALATLERDLDARDQILRKSLTRWGTLVLSLAVTAVLAQLLGARFLGPKDLAAGKPWKTSTVGLVCTPDQHLCGGTRTDIFFHTALEQNPWFELDLGEPTTFSRLSIHNRQDMGVTRAIPLVVEVGDDGTTWKEVARQPVAFDVWKPAFEPTTARRVRLRVLDKKTWFHLEAVKVHK